MTSSHNDSIPINWTVRNISGRYVHIGVTCVTLNSGHGILLGSKNKVAVALLCKWIDHDLCWNTLRQISILTLTLRSDVVSAFFYDVDDDIDVALYAPVVILLTELESYSV